MAAKRYSLLVGGSRSGKTFIFLRNLINRALFRESSHLIVRKTFKSIKRSIWLKTLPDVLSICFPEFKEGYHYTFNRTDFFIKFWNNSTIWIGGIDDRERMDRILGTEYSTTWLNEASEFIYDHVETILSRLAENSGISLKFWADCNPPSNRHWIHKLFIEKINPATEKELSSDELSRYGYLLINPVHNRSNLPSAYFDVLDSFGKRKRDRFRDGLFQKNTEGALWDNDLVNNAQLKESEKESWMSNAPQTIVALDPNVAAERKEGEEFKADDAGIIVMSKDTPLRDTEGTAIVKADYSGPYSSTEWAKKAVWAYQVHNADCIVAEVNQGGELVKINLRAEDSTVPVKKVRASKGKYARAEPVVTLYEKGQIKHGSSLEELESEMVEFIPGISSGSPNRMDALVWGATYLFLNEVEEKAASIRVRIL